MIDDLTLEKANAKAIIALGINAEVYTEDMPKTAKDINEAAHELVSFCIDTWVDDGVRPDSEDEDEANVGKEIAEIFLVAGIEVDDEGNIEIGDQPEVEVKKKGDGWEVAIDAEEADEDDSDGDEDEEGDEAAFDIDEVVADGYADLTDASKLKAIKALKLDGDEDEDYNTLVSIEEFENEQDKPSTKVLNLIESLLPEEDEEGEGEEDGEEVDGEVEDADDDESDEEAGDGEEDDSPWTEEELKDLDNDDLKKLATEAGMESVPKRVTDKGIQRMIDAILAAQEEAEEGDEDAEGEEEGYQEPWEGYDTDKLADIKSVINEDDRAADEIEYLLEYEQQREKPRKTVISAIEKRLAEFSDDEAGEEVDAAVDRDDAEDDRKAKKGRGRKSTKAAASDDDVPEGLSGAFVKSKLVEKTVRESGLAEPSEFTDEMPELPADIDAVDHSDLSNLLLAFQNAYSTAIWKSSLAYISSDIYEEIANYLKDQAILGTDESNDAKRRADAASDATYLAWRGKFKESYHEYVAFRDLARTIEGKIKVLSRVGGFKDDEQQAGDRTAKSKPKATTRASKPAAEPATEEEVAAPAEKKTTAKRTTRKAPAKTTAKPAAAKTGTKRRVRR